MGPFWGHQGVVVWLWNLRQSILRVKYSLVWWFYKPNSTKIVGSHERSCEQWPVINWTRRPHKWRGWSIILWLLILSTVGKNSFVCRSPDFCPNDFCPNDFCRLTNAQKTFAQQTFAQNTRKWKLAGQLAPPSHVLHVAVCFSRFYLYGNENFGKFTRFPFMIRNFHQASLFSNFEVPWDVILGNLQGSLFMIWNFHQASLVFQFWSDMGSDFWQIHKAPPILI